MNEGVKGGPGRHDDGAELEHNNEGRRDRLSGGDVGLNTILDGGIPRDSLYIVTGPPGAGKTVFAQQVSFAAAAAGLCVIYFTNVSEPHAKLVQHMRGFAFYEPDVVGERIRIYNITAQIRDKGFKETCDFIVETVRGERANLVVIDSFRGLKHVLDVHPRDRGAIFDLAAQISILGCTGLLVGEYTPHEIVTDPEFAVADGIINLAYSTDSIRQRRTIRISKMRGQGYLSGEHSFEIDGQGFVVYPRQESLAQAPRYRASEERVPTGIDALDEMLRGGLIRSSSTLIAGSAGTGKTLLSLYFLAAGIARGEPGLFVSFQENAEQLRLRAAKFGLDIGRGGAGAEILALSPVELDLDVAAARVRAAVEAHGIKRVVIDSVAELEFGTDDPARFDDFLASLVGYLREREVTTLMTREITQLFGDELNIASRGLSYIVDNIILLRYIELQAQIRRAVAVLKSRGSDHDKSVREMLVYDGRVSIGDRFRDLAGLMTGLPRASEPPRTGAGYADSARREG